MTKDSDSKVSLDATLSNLTLGKVVEYKQEYAPELLQPVPRSLSRDTLGLDSELPFHGVDIWNGYELSWLNRRGKPCVAILTCHVPITSPNLIESKSFKMYLNSFNQHKFASIDDVQACLQRDLSHCAGQSVEVSLLSASRFASLSMQEFKGDNIDELDIEVEKYELNPDLLEIESTEVEEALTSNLLKSNCLITNQPDWASVLIKYQGNRIKHESLLRYLISFRMHNEFHEQCVERIFCDIMRRCQPRKLTVYARYTRRGGLDINPFRSNFEMPYAQFRQARQ